MSRKAKGPGSKVSKPKSIVRGVRFPAVTQNRVLVALIVIVTAAFTLSLVGMGVVAVTSGDPPTTLQSRFAEVCDYTLKVTLGALVGLLGWWQCRTGSITPRVNQRRPR
jgi:protein-S-isoprenylcysteine O-methyltransferase Ste14